MSPIRDLIAMPGANVKAEHLLGLMVMFTVPERMVEYRQVAAEWSNAGLDIDLLPLPGKPIDVFAQACRAVATDNKRGAREVVLVEQAQVSATECTYQITRSVRDSANRVVEHPKAMKLTYTAPNANKPTDQWKGAKIVVEQLEDYDRLAPLEKRIRQNLADFKDKIRGEKIRSAVRVMLITRLHGTDYMRKGVYLVPVKHEKTLETLNGVLKKWYGDDAHIVIQAVLNTRSDKDNLARFHTDDIQERVEKLMVQIGQKLQSGAPIRKDMLQGVLEENRTLVSQRDTVQAMIGSSIAKVDDQLQLVSAQIKALLERQAQNGKP